jgi:hypothetical protein
MQLLFTGIPLFEFFSGNNGRSKLKTVAVCLRSAYLLKIQISFLPSSKKNCAFLIRRITLSAFHGLEEASRELDERETT